VRSDVVNAADQAAAAEVMRNQGLAEGRVAVTEGWLPGLQQAAANAIPGTSLTRPPTICRWHHRQYRLGQGPYDKSINQ
jgi:hypothetical protein